MENDIKNYINLGETYRISILDGIKREYYKSLNGYRNIIEIYKILLRNNVFHLSIRDIAEKLNNPHELNKIEAGIFMYIYNANSIEKGLNKKIKKMRKLIKQGRKEEAENIGRNLYNNIINNEMETLRGSYDKINKIKELINETDCNGKQNTSRI